jgi:hypothetical protein
MSINRVVRETAPVDVNRGIARLSSGDLTELGIKLSGAVRLESKGGKVAYARCLAMRPEEERLHAESVTIDGLIRGALAVTIGEEIRVTYANIDTEATSITLDSQGVPLGSSLPPDYIIGALEGRVLWKGAVVTIPVEGKPHVFRVARVEPLGVEACLTSMRTKVLLQAPPGSDLQVVTLVSLALRMDLGTKPPDYGVLSKQLVQKGFTSPMPGTGLLLPSGADPYLARRPGFPPHGAPESRLPLERGSVQVFFSDQAELDHSLQVQFINKRIVPRETQDSVSDVEETVRLVMQVLRLHLNGKSPSDLNVLVLQAHFRVQGHKDSGQVLRATRSLEFSPVFAQLRGYRDGGQITLYPITNDRSLVQEGLMDICIGANGSNTYDVYVRYGLAGGKDPSELIPPLATRSAMIVSLIEQNAPP